MGQSGELFCFGQMPVWKVENLLEVLLSGYSSEEGEWVCLNVLQGDVEVRTQDGSAEVWSGQKAAIACLRRSRCFRSNRKRTMPKSVCRCIARRQTSFTKNTG